MTPPRPIPGFEERACATCRDFRCPASEIQAFGAKAVGSCASGGPDPSGSSGAYSSDVGADDSCDRWKEASDARGRG